MKRNDIIALHQLSIEELSEKLIKLEAELNLAKLEIKAGKRKNTHSRLLADNIARMKTILGVKQKELIWKNSQATGEKS